MSDLSKSDSGFFHLTPNGWTRQDGEPFPADRIETWRYEMELPADDAKERVCLTRVWRHPGMSPEQCNGLRQHFSPPLRVGLERNVTLECLT
jgi:hypothetical protein